MRSSCVVCCLYTAELPYAPVIQSVALSRDESRAIVLTWQPGFDGNSPIIKFTVEYQAVPEGKDLKHATKFSKCTVCEVVCIPVQRNESHVYCHASYDVMETLCL